MNPYSRKEFLQASALILAGTAFLRPAFATENPSLSFSSLGCPDWPFTQIVEFAKQNNYSGIELRGILRELDLNKCPEFSSKEGIDATMKIMKEAGLRFVCLGSSTNLHIEEPVERKKNLDDGKRFIDLANKIGSPFIRVFPNAIPKDQDKDHVLDLISKGLVELGDYATGKNVMVLMETHGDLVHTADLEKVMTLANHPNVGLVWDVSNMWTVTKQPPAEVYAALKKYIHHTHIKDARIDGDKINYVFLGRGEVPIFEAIDILWRNQYRGYFSFEWEKLWHPEIEASEKALADYPLAMKKHFG